jgi:hypothetical protein
MSLFSENVTINGTGFIIFPFYTSDIFAEFARVDIATVKPGQAEKIDNIRVSVILKLLRNYYFDGMVG